MSGETIEIPVSSLSLHGHHPGFEAENYEFMLSHSKYFVSIYAVSAPQNCALCHEYFLYEYQDGTVTITNEPCAYVFEETVTGLAVPSGKLIIDDNLMEVYTRPDGISINSFKGQKQAIKHFSSLGCAYGPAFNGGLGFYRTADHTYVVASLAMDEVTEEVILPAGWESLAYICTDHWAYMIADYELFKSQGGLSLEQNDCNGTRTVVAVKPGDYMVRYHPTGEHPPKDEDFASQRIFATFTLLPSAS